VLTSYAITNDLGGARTHDLRINSAKLTKGHWGLSNSKQDRKRPSSLLSVPIVPIETNGLSTVCLQCGVRMPGATLRRGSRTPRGMRSPEALRQERNLRQIQPRCRTFKDSTLRTGDP